MSKIDELEDFLVEALDSFACCSIVRKLGFVKDKSSYEVYHTTKQLGLASYPMAILKSKNHEQMVRFSTLNETNL